MLKFYLITIGLFYLSFVLMYMRCHENKMKCKLGDKYSCIRFIILSLIPIVNILMGIIWVYYSTLASNEKFIKVMSE
jgi:hypothetical protein